MEGSRKYTGSGQRMSLLSHDEITISCWRGPPSTVVVRGWTMTEKTSELTRDDLWGGFWLKRKDGAGQDWYYDTLDSLGNLFDSESFQENVSGFYINCINGWVRVHYFTPENKMNTAINTIQEYICNDIFEVKDCKLPESKCVAKNYGGSDFELRFRKYLIIETQIGLELLRFDRLYSQCLLTTLRWWVKAIKGDIKSHIEPSLLKMSPSYSKLSTIERDIFLEDLDLRPENSETDWAHFIVNLVVSIDWRNTQSVVQGRLLSIEELNLILTSGTLDFRIPAEWAPIKEDS